MISAKILCKYHGNFSLVGVGNEFETNIVPRRTLRVTINEISVN